MKNKKEKPDWETLKIPRDLSNDIDDFLETEKAKKRGYYNKASFISDAIRDALEEYQKKPLVHLNTYEDKIRILDNQKNRIAEITFKNNKPFCDLCETGDCIHIQYAWGIEDIARQLKLHGLKPPT